MSAVLPGLEQNAGGGWSLSDLMCIMVGEHAVHVQEPRILDAER